MMAKCLKPHQSKDALSFNIKGEMRGGRQSLTPSPLQNEGREIKPHPQPLPEEGGEQLAMEMEGIVLGLIRGGDVVDN